MPVCENARQGTYTDANGLHFETFWLGDDFIFENQIRNLSSYTRTHPGWVLADNHFCEWKYEPPERFWETSIETVEPIPTVTANDVPMTAQANAATATEGGGAFLLVIALLGAAGYAFWQQRSGKSDEEIAAENYHPMDDVPPLPPVYTEEDLDAVYGRYDHPQYQGITEPNPFSRPPSPPPPHHHIPPPPPPDSTSIPPVESTDSTTGGGAVVDPREVFEMRWVPAPARGYFLGEESLLSPNTEAYRIVVDAVNASVSTNYLLNHIFKVSKNSKGHQLLMQLIDTVKGEMG
jgi:hypothetical protein